jgi:voltage-gated potassium channel
VDKQNSSYLIFILFLSLFALAALAVEAIMPLSASSREVLNYTDLAVCVLFFGDFVIQLYKAENKRRYLCTWGLLDLASCVPIVNVLRWGRVARIMRIFRVLRGIRATRILTEFILDRRSESTFFAAALVSIMLITISSISLLHFEVSAEGNNIKTAEDAVWWAITTITTVGYGDKYPVTTEGRIIAIFLMAAGVGLFGVFSGFIAAWFLTPNAKKSEIDLSLLRKEIAELKLLLKDKTDNKTAGRPLDNS